MTTANSCVKWKPKSSITQVLKSQHNNFSVKHYLVTIPPFIRTARTVKQRQGNKSSTVMAVKNKHTHDTDCD